MSGVDPRFYAFRNAALWDRPTAQRLVERDASLLEARNGIGETAFHFLVVEDELEAVQWLLERGSDINTRNNFGGTPLMDAAGLGYRGMCRFLMDRGADLRMRDDSGDTAIATAASTKKVAVLKYLLSRLAESENVNNYFSDVTANSVVERGGRAAELLMARGLIDP